MEINQDINNIENLSSKLNFSFSLNNKENQYFYENIKKYEEEKNDPILSLKIKYNNSIMNENNNNQNKKQEQIIINKEESKIININKEEFLSNDLFLDEIKLKVDYDKIENELNKLRNNNVEENESKEKDNKNDINNEIKNKHINDYNDKSDNKDNNAKNHQRLSLYSNSQLDGDLFYYSEEEDEKMKIIKSNIEKIKLIRENINKIERIKKENDIKITNGKNQILDINNNINNDYNNNIRKSLIEKAEYGIDETGNPLSIKNYNEEKFKNEKSKKLIAYIITSVEKGENYLLDLKGEIVPKTKDGDFYYKFNNRFIIIKNFDVQNPKLRVFGARQRFSSILSEEDPITKIEKNNITENNNKQIFLFNLIKDNIIPKNEKIYYNESKYSPITNRNNYFEQKLNDNIKNNEYFNNWMKKYSPMTEKGSIFHYNRNNKDILYQKIPLKKKDEKIYNKLQNNERSNLLRKTSFILNRTANKNLVINNQKLIEKLKDNSSLRNIFFEKKQLRNNARRNNRTPSPLPISPIIKSFSLNNDLFKIKKPNEYIYQPDPIKNNNTSRVNIYKIQRLKKGGIGNFKNYFKLNLENNNNQNQYYSSSETEVLKNSYFSYFNKNFFRGSNPLSNNNDLRMVKSSNSSFLKFDTNNRNNNFIKKNNPLLKKSLCSNNSQLTLTLNSIAINIKKIENNIKSTLRKLVYKNKVLDTNNEKIRKEKGIMSYSSKNKRFINIPNRFSCYPNKKNMVKYKSYKNLNSEKKINLLKIPLYKKYKISTSPDKNFQYTVISPEANKMIKDYSNKSIIQKNVKENPIIKLINTQN